MRITKKNGSATDMFKDADPVDKSALTGVTCELPHSQRGTDVKTTAKRNKRACTGLKVKFDLNYYQLPANSRRNIMYRWQPETHKMLLPWLPINAKNRKIASKYFNLRNACIVPTSKDKHRSKPSERWDFRTHEHL